MRRISSQLHTLGEKQMMPTIWWLRKMQSTHEPHPGNTWEEISGIGVPSGTPRVKTDKYSVVNVPVLARPEKCCSHEGLWPQTYGDQLI